MSKDKAIWLYSMVGYTQDFRLFLKNFKEKLSEFDTNGDINLFNNDKNIWEWVSQNCYGNYDKDDKVLENFQSVVVNYDEMNNLVNVQVYSSADAFRVSNNEFFAKRILMCAADLTEEPNHWIVAFASGKDSKPMNYYAKACSVPATEEDFTITDAMYDSYIDNFGKTVPTVEGYKSMIELISESGDTLTDSLGINTNNIEEVLSDLTSIIDEKGVEALDSIRQPYEFFEMIYKPINPTVRLIRDAASYTVQNKCFNTTNIYSEIPEAFVETVKPSISFPINTFVYSRDDIDFIKVSCEIEKEVLGTDIEIQLKEIDTESVDDFFS